VATEPKRRLKVAAVQGAPLFLDAQATTERIVARIHDAADPGVDLPREDRE
jgi:predicted amidohydrolase